MSQRERRGVPPLRLIETMMAGDESDNGGAPATYQEALLGPEGKEWQKAFDVEVKDNPVDDPGKERMEKYPYRQVVVKCIDLMTYSQSAKSLAENPVYHGRSKHILAKWHLSYGNESCRIQRDNHVVCRFTNVFVKIGV